MEGRRLIRESGCAGRVSSERTDGRVRMAHMIRGNPCAYHTPHTSRAWREARQVSSVASHVLCDIIQVYNLDNSDLSIRCIVTCNYVAWNTDYGHAEGCVYSMYSTRTVYRTTVRLMITNDLMRSMPHQLRTEYPRLRLIVYWDLSSPPPHRRL